jgi:hypothetical protein
MRIPFHGNPRRVTVDRAGVHNHYPVWSLDGKWIYGMSDHDALGMRDHDGVDEVITYKADAAIQKLVDLLAT